MRLITQDRQSILFCRMRVRERELAAHEGGLLKYKQMETAYKTMNIGIIGREKEKLGGVEGGAVKGDYGGFSE